MKYTFLSMGPIDEFDSVIKVRATPSWLEEMLGRKKRLLRYYGSGSTWRKGQNGPHCNFFTSEWLHQIWSTELNRAHDAKNSRSPRDVSDGALRSH